MSHRLARVILALSISATLAAAGAGVLAVVQLSGLNGARVGARADDCRLLKGLVYSATPSPKARARAAAYIHRTPLRDCTHYARYGN